jgi:HEAT repeat protein
MRQVMNYIETLVVAALVAVITDWVIQAFRKSPSHIFAPFIRLWKEASYLHNILHKADKDFGKVRINRFARWMDINGKYIALKGNGLEKESGEKTVVIERLRAYIKNSTPAILVGEPGSGKTTTLEALTCQIAVSSYKINIFFWLGFIILACILLFLSPLISFIYLLSFFLWEPLVRRTFIPMFIEARYLTDEINDMEKWCDNQRKEKIGDKPILGSQHRIVWLIDGVNELTSDALYGSFIKGWRKLTQDGKATHVIFSNRTWESLSSGLGIKSIIRISELDDDLVRRFLHNQEEYNKLETEQLLERGGIGRNPYWLKLMVEAGVYSPNKGKVIYGYVEKLLTREIDITKSPKSADFIPKDYLLIALANLGMTLEKENLLSLIGKDALNRAWSIMEGSLSNQYSGKVILEKAKDATLLKQDGIDKVTFVHPLLQTFFVAYDLYLGEAWKQELHLADDFRWWQTFLILGDIIADQSPETYKIFVESILDDGESVRRTYLAAAILESTVTNRPILFGNWFEIMAFNSADFLKHFEFLSPSFKWHHLLTRYFHSFTSDIEQKIVIGLLKGILNKSIDEHKNSLNKLREIQGDSILERLAAYSFVDDYNRPEIARAAIKIFQSLGDKKVSAFIVMMLGYEKTKEVAYDALLKIGENAVDALLTALGWRKFEDISAEIEHLPIEESKNIDLDKQIQFLQSLIDITDDKEEKTLYREELRNLMAVKEMAKDALNTVLYGRDLLKQVISPFSEEKWHKQIEDYILDELRKQGNEELIPFYSQYFQKMWELERRIPDYRVIQKILCEIGDPAVPYLINCLSNLFLCERAAETLGMIGGADAINALATLMYVPHRAHMAYSPLEKIGEPALDILFQLLNSNNQDVSTKALIALGRFDHKVVFDRLINIIGQVNLSQGTAALLFDLLNEQQDKREIIFSILDKEKGDVWLEMYLLRLILEMGDSAIEALVSRLSNEESYFTIHLALRKLGENAVKPLINSLETQDHKIRKEVLNELVGLAIHGIEKDQIINELLRIIQSDDIDPSDRNDLVTQFVFIGKPAINSLGKLLESENSPYWFQAFLVLHDISSIHYFAPKPLIAALNSTNEKTRMTALGLFMTGHNLSFLPYILARFPHESKEWRNVFIRLLPSYLFRSAKAILNYPKYWKTENSYRKALAQSRKLHELEASQIRK